MARFSWKRLSVLVTLLILWCTSVASGQLLPEPTNQVVLVIDGSGSFRARQTEAIERAATLLEGMAQTKFHRWEPATDRITLMSLDALPEILWQGTLQDLKKIDRAAWITRFRARTDYVNCTDVGAAFRLAAQQFAGNSRYVSKYLFVFSDLIHEPPATSLSACRSRTLPSLPPEDFPWGALQDVSVAIFWVPPDQKLAWRRAVEEQGLTTSFALYSDSESATVTVTPPPRPKIELSEAERQAERERYVGYGMTLAKGLGIILGLIVILPAGIVLVSRLWQRRARPTPIPASRNIRPLPVGARRPGAPLPPTGPRPLGPRPSPSSHNHRQ